MLVQVNANALSAINGTAYNNNNLNSKYLTNKFMHLDSASSEVK